MTYYTPETIPDNPYRVAPPYQAPGEVEPPDAVCVSDAEAVRRVLDVLLSDDPESRAFGETAEDWIDWLHEFVTELGSRAFLIALLDTSNPSVHPVVRRGLDTLIGDHANARLAEMSPDELEREGFL